MRRCSAIVVVVVALVASFGRPSVAASSAPAGTPPPARVVHVCDCPASAAQEERSELVRLFAKVGYVEGRNLELTTYSVETLNDASRGGGPLYSLGEQFGPNPYASFFKTRVARSQPQLVLASGVRVVAAARDSQVSTPVVFWRITDPVGLGFVAALARPGGNLTGFSRAIEKLTVKRLELLHEMVPGAQQVAFVYIEDFAAHVRQAAEVKAAAARIGLRVRDYALPWTHWNEVELEALFATMRRDGIGTRCKPVAVQHVPEEALRGQYNGATDSLQQSFAALMLYCARGDVIDTTEALRLIPVERLKSVRDHFAAALVAS